MNIKYIFCIIAAASALAVAAQAKTHRKKKASCDFKLLEAYTQKTTPGRQGSPVQTDYHFILLWQAAAYPKTFFWRGDNGWLTCVMQKAHKIPPKDTRKMPEGIEYITENVVNGDVRKNDTLELTPVRGGKFPIPKDIPDTAKNTLFYKVGNSGWIAFPVKQIGKKQDISMP